MATEQAPQADAPRASGEAGGAPPADVQRIAERVYQLMVADARLERARAGAVAAGGGTRR